MLEIVASIPFTLNLIIKKINNRAKIANNTIIVFFNTFTVIEDSISVSYTHLTLPTT